MARILIVDDDRSLLELLADYLGRSGYDVEVAPDGQQALGRIAETPPDLILLDVTMPGLDGWQVLARIRAATQIPVIMLTARGDEPEILRGFAGGADDYVVKPFSFAQLVARIAAVIERSAHLHPDQSGILRGADLEVDVHRHRVYRAGELVDLTPTEFRILVTLMRERGKVISVRQIVAAVWGAEYAEETGYIRRYVWHLRRKLERDPHDPKYIVNERSVGYVFPADD